MLFIRDELLLNLILVFDDYLGKVFDCFVEYDLASVLTDDFVSLFFSDRLGIHSSTFFDMFHLIVYPFDSL